MEVRVNPALGSHQIKKFRRNCIRFQGAEPYPEIRRQAGPGKDYFKKRQEVCFAVPTVAAQVYSAKDYFPVTISRQAFYF